MAELLQDNTPDSVEITKNTGEWSVRVVRGGKSEIATFEVEAFARCFASGQRAGLHLSEPAEQPKNQEV